jgi:hypothetical protein
MFMDLFIPFNYGVRKAPISRISLLFCARLSSERLHPFLQLYLPRGLFYISSTSNNYSAEVEIFQVLGMDALSTILSSADDHWRILIECSID